MDVSDQEGSHARIRSVIERLIRDGTVRSKSDDTEHSVFPVAVSPAEGQALRDWVCREGAAKTIEVGLGYGVSALHICEGLLVNDVPEARHVVLDPAQSSRFSGCGLQLLEEAGVSALVQNYPQESQLALPQFLREGRKFDLGFIDGNHRFDAVFLDMYYLGRLIPRGGIVILDDYHWPGVHRAVSFYVKNRDWTIEEIVEDHSVVLRTARGPDTQDGRYFVEF